MIVKVEPKSRRAKNRVSEHGETFELLRFDNFRGNPSALVRSQDKEWMGWFTEDEACVEIQY